MIIKRCEATEAITPKIMMMSGTPIRNGILDLLGVSSLWSLCVLVRENEYIGQRQIRPDFTAGRLRLAWNEVDVRPLLETIHARRPG